MTEGGTEYIHDSIVFWTRFEPIQLATFPSRTVPPSATQNKGTLLFSGLCCLFWKRGWLNLLEISQIDNQICLHSTNAPTGFRCWPNKLWSQAANLPLAKRAETNTTGGVTICRYWGSSSHLTMQLLALCQPSPAHECRWDILRV